MKKLFAIFFLVTVLISCNSENENYDQNSFKFTLIKYPDSSLNREDMVFL